MRTTALSRCILVGATLGWATAALADAEEPIRIMYQAPSGCPDQAAFEAAIRQRVPFTTAGADEPARTLIVTVSASDGAFGGSLTLRDAAGTDTVRTVSSRQCDEVVTALALIAALSIDGDASPEPVASPAKPVRVPVVRKAPPAEPARRAKQTVHWHLAVGVLVAAHAGVSPNLLFALPVFMEVGRRAGTSLWQPSLRVRFTRASEVVIVGASSASFTWTVGRAELCPMRFELRSSFALEPCAIVEAGVLTGSGEMVGSPRSESSLWVAPGLLGRLRMTVFRNVFIEMDLAAAFPQFRDRYYFGTDLLVHRVPWITGVAALGVGVSFL